MKKYYKETFYDDNIIFNSDNIDSNDLYVTNNNWVNELKNKIDKIEKIIKLQSIEIDFLRDAIKEKIKLSE